MLASETLSVGGRQSSASTGSFCRRRRHLSAWRQHAARPFRAQRPASWTPRLSGRFDDDHLHRPQPDHPSEQRLPALPYRTLRPWWSTPSSLRWAPEFPLIVYSHGFGATAASALPTLDRSPRTARRRGPDFPLSTTGLTGGLDLLDYVNQPGDVGFVILRCSSWTSRMARPCITRSSPSDRSRRTFPRSGHHPRCFYDSCCPRYWHRCCCGDGRRAERPDRTGRPVAGTYFEASSSVAYRQRHQGHDRHLCHQSAIYAEAPAQVLPLAHRSAPRGLRHGAVEPNCQQDDGRVLRPLPRDGPDLAQIKRAGSKPGVTTIRVRVH